MTTTFDSRAAAPVGRPLSGTHRTVPVAAQALIYGGAAAVLGLWWSDTASVVGLDGWLTDAGRITGLLAGYASVVLLALMARIPALDRSVGSDRLARWHAMGGRYVVSLAVAHTLLIIVGYSLTTHTNLVGQTTTLVFQYPKMLKGTVGFVLLLGTGIASARAARRKLRYETWHYLHFLTYLAIFLAFGHQLADGADFVGNRPAQLAWYAMYAGVAVLLVWYRFITPIRTAARHQLTVAQVRRESPGVVSVYLTGRHLDELRAEAGQFFRWRFLVPGMWWAANPYSLSAAPDSRYLRITVKAVGDHSAYLVKLRPGTKVWAEGPYGAFTASRRRGKKVLLLAGGVGITPLRALFETMPGQVTMIYRARRPKDLALRGELDQIAAARGATVHYVVDEPAEHSVPLTADGLRALVPDVCDHDVYLCGPPGMTAAALQALNRAGVPRSRVHHESFQF